MKFSRQNRVLITIKGSDALRFSSGLWTCDLKLCAKVAPTSTKGYLLNTKGQALAEGSFVVLSEQSIVLSVLESDKEFVITEMQKVLVADDVELCVNEMAGYKTYLSLDDKNQGQEIDIARPEFAKDYIAKVDVSEESYKCIFPYGPALVKEYWVSSKVTEAEFISKYNAELVSCEEFNSWCVQNNAAFWKQDIEFEKLLLNFPVSKCISFHKGCYRGQEIIARATHRGNLQIGWGAFSSDQKIEAGDVLNSEKKVVGKVTSTDGLKALGTIRLKSVEEKIFASNGCELSFLESFN